MIAARSHLCPLKSDREEEFRLISADIPCQWDREALCRTVQGRHTHL